LILSALVTSCDRITAYHPSSTSSPVIYPTSTQNTPVTEALITFRVKLPTPLPAGDSIYLTVLDEVTGLALNTQQYIMEAEDENHYVVMLPFSLGSVVKYRYTRQGATLAQEHFSDGRSVRYRLYYVQGPGLVQDVLNRWTDTSFTGQSGRIAGQVISASDGSPIPNILVTAGGCQVYTHADGSFLIEGLLPGTQNLVAYALDGAYQTFQQGASVDPGSTTPALIHLNPATFVTVAFMVNVPEDTPADVPIRLAGNLYQLGNTFADLSGGVSTIASRMPILTPLPDGRYILTVRLPSGADIRYKYSLGDGLWNAERSLSGGFLLRQLIVPTHDIQLQDTIQSWHFGSPGPIYFNLSVPDNTPPNEVISIQFDPSYGWTEPIPMWPANDESGNRIWVYNLYSPLDLIETLQYRYCREDQCGKADDINTMGINPEGHKILIDSQPQTMKDQVSAWAWLPEISYPAIVPNINIQPRGPDFVAGIAFQEDYRPSWAPRIPNAISEVQGLGINYLILCPTWTVTRNNPPLIEIVPGQDVLWAELVNWISQSHQLSLNVGLFPTPRLAEDDNLWWQQTNPDFSWWVTWFENYRQFVLHHADLASRQDVQTLILGGEWVLPALPNGRFPDGISSNVPIDAEERWRSLISEIRTHYGGKLAWGLPYPEGVENPPSFLDAFDQIYIILSTPPTNQTDDTLPEFEAEYSKILDSDIFYIQQNTGKPIIIAIAYPSESAKLAVGLKEQETAYNSLLMEINKRDWIKGIVSLGYYPPVPLADPSPSIHGKPASGVLWYWFPLLLGK
jgi:hypothetical protein